MKVTLIAHSMVAEAGFAVESISAIAIGQCYNKSFDLADVSQSTNLLEHVINSGHESVIEHITFTFLIEGVSRSLTHQLVRHRIASYTQKSQRYTDGSDFTPIIPESILHNKQKKEVFDTCMDSIKDAYKKLKELGTKDEDARAVLPNACDTNIVVTMNARVLGHLFAERRCVRAQDEINQLVTEMSKICRKVCPTIFKTCKLGFAKCVRLGYCPEGKTCGRYPRLKDLLKNKEYKTVNE